MKNTPVSVFLGMTYRLGDLYVPVMAVDDHKREVCLLVYKTRVWVPAEELWKDHV